MRIALPGAARTLAVASLAAAGVLLVAGAVSAQAPAGYVPVPATVQELMVNIFTPASDAIWQKSYADNLTGEDWLSMQRAAVELAAGASIISLGGSDGAAKGWTSQPAWQEWSQKLSGLAGTMKTAADSKAQMDLATAGDSMLEVCEGCHLMFLPQP